MTDHYNLCRLAALHRRIPPFDVSPFLLCHDAMSKTIMITGGARSGKSALAEARTLSLRTGAQAHYIATAQAFDTEMEARIATHRARRGPEWINHAEPLDIVSVIRATDTAPRLVDCLTLWLTNLMLGEHDWNAATESLLTALAEQTHPVIFVTNELGSGIVPDNALARAFRDAAGALNQRIAAQADEVTLAVCGLPVKVK
jgi:adenosylcobinamide kinase/adenosylcobinamide-phosphate guanylyltransferase